MRRDMTFQEWLDETLLLQREAFGQDPPMLMGESRADWMMMNCLALHAEVTEMSDEMGWKPWTQPRGWANRSLVISEVADQMHFQANILNTLGVTGDELAEALRSKIDRNRARQLAGDNGVDRRCPGCKRSLDDLGVEDFGPTGQCPACGYKGASA